MLLLSLRLLRDLLHTSFEAGTHHYGVGPLIAETFNRSLRQVEALVPEARALSSLPWAAPWSRPVDLYVRTCQVLDVYMAYLERHSVRLIGSDDANANGGAGGG